MTLSLEEETVIELMRSGCKVDCYFDHCNSKDSANKLMDPMIPLNPTVKRMSSGSTNWVEARSEFVTVTVFLEE